MMRLSCREIARRCGVSPATISLILKHGRYPKKGAEELREKLSLLLAYSHNNGGASLPSGEEDAALSDGAGLFCPAPERKASLTKHHGKIVPPPKTEEKPMLRKQSLLPKTRQAFKIHGDPFGAEARAAEDVYMNENVRYVSEAVYMTAKHGGMMAVIGESGSGKSTLRRHLLDRMRHEALPVIAIEPYVIAMDEDSSRGRPLRAEHIAEAILHTLAPSSRVPRSPEARFRSLHSTLKESARAGNRHVLLIEEAHDLHGHTLKQLKRFHELEDGFERLLAIILFGQSELKAKLGESDVKVREVVQRLELAELRPLNDPESYIRHRLERAGLKFESLFAPGAMDALRLKHERGKVGRSARESVSLLYPLALSNTLIAACNLAAELGMEKVSGDIINRV